MHLLLVGAWPELANHLVGLPARVSLLQLPGARYGREADWVHRYVELDYADVAAAVVAAKRVHAADPVDVVVGLRELALPAFTEIAAALAVPSMPGPVGTLGRDKAEVRDVISAGAARPVRYRICRGAAEIGRFAHEIGFPVIVKPPAGAGGIGVHAVTGPDEVAIAWQHATSAGGVDAVLAEELVAGPEFSVEVRSVAGRHEVIAVTEKLTSGLPHFVELGHVLPARIGPAQATSLRDEAVRAITALGHLTGPSHVELVLTSQGPAVVEINRRMGGDRIFELITLATGRDLMRESLLDAIGVEHQPSADRGRGAAIRFLSAQRPARLAAQLPTEAAGEVDELVRVRFTASPCAEVLPASSSDGRFGYVLTAAATAHQAAVAAKTAQRLVAQRLFADDGYRSSTGDLDPRR